MGKPVMQPGPSNEQTPGFIDEAQSSLRAGRRLLLILLALVLLITTLHYLLPPSNFVLHSILQRLYYIPIVWAAYSISRKSAIFIAVLSAVAYLPHIFMTWGAHPAYQSAQVIEVLLFPVIGFVGGWLSEREAELRQTALGYARMAQFGSVARSVIRSLKSPVRSIQGVLISLEASIGDLPGAREFIHVIRTQTESIADVRTSLITLVERKRVRLAVIDLNELATEFAQQVTPLLGRSNVGLEPHLASRPLKCRVARKHLLRCLHRLIEEMTTDNELIEAVTIYTGESGNSRWVGCSSGEVRLHSYYLSELSRPENGNTSDYSLIDVINTMNSHFGSVRVRRRKSQLVEFILVLPRRLRLPWYLKAEVKTNRKEGSSPDHGS
ncbi:hypothetical protein KQH82_04265 [bacterium]|nr:hypothetical protein [bacterium]